MSEKRVVVYTQPGCSPCNAAKEFLSSNHVPFIEKDITQNPEAIDELLRLGATATPTITVDDEVIIGFDRRRLSELLDL